MAVDPAIAPFELPSRLREWAREAVERLDLLGMRDAIVRAQQALRTHRRYRLSDRGVTVESVRHLHGQRTARSLTAHD